MPTVIGVATGGPSGPEFDPNVTL